MPTILLIIFIKIYLLLYCSATITNQSSKFIDCARNCSASAGLLIPILCADVGQHIFASLTAFTNFYSCKSWYNLDLTPGSRTILV